MSRTLGVDLGERRIGLAISDPLGTIASPYLVIERQGNPAADYKAIIAAAVDGDAMKIVVGLPRSLSGRKGPAERSAISECDAIRALVPETIEVEMFDERLTTVIAQRSLIEAGVHRKNRKKIVDKVAAAVMLQSFLDSHG